MSENISKSEIENIINALNSVKTAEELAEIIEIPGQPDVGIKIAESILKTRAQNGLFSNLMQIKEIPLIGPKRFSQIINTLKNYSEPYEISFESEVSVPVLSYKVPSPSSYEGRNYIELETFEFGIKDEALMTPEPKEEIKQFFEANRETIYEYLKNATKHDLERDLFLVFDIDDIVPQQVKVQFPATISFDNKDWRKDWVMNHTRSVLKRNNEYRAHKKVMQFYNTKGEGAKYRLVEHIFKDPIKNGTIEFWFAVHGFGNYFYVFLGDTAGSRDPSGMCIVDIATFGNQLKYYDRTKGWVSLGKIGAKKWHHMRIDFDYDSENVVIYLDQKVSLRSGFFHHQVGRQGVETLSFAILNTLLNKSIFIDAIGFSWDPNYEIGDNLASDAILDAQSAIKNDVLNRLDTIDPKVTEMLDEIKIEVDDQGNVIDYGLTAKYQLFKYFVQVAFAYRKMAVFYNTMGGKLKLRYVQIPAINPRIMLVENYKLTNYPGDYGLGKVIKTFSLLPGEETEISIKTWKKSITSTKEASSVLDSYTDEKADEFENNIQNESSQTSKIAQSSTLSANASSKSTWGASASASYFGIGGSVSAGGEREQSLGVETSISSSREAFAKNVMNSTAKHSQKASAKREINIETSYERTEEQGEEMAIVRKIENLNVSRALNFTFRQMNQEFHSLLHLFDLRLAFFNGYPGSMKEYQLHEIDDFIRDNIEFIEGSLAEAPTETSSEATAEEAVEAPKLTFNEVRERLIELILNIYGKVPDYLGTKRNFVEKVEIENEYKEKVPYLRIIPPIGKTGKQVYVIKEEPRDLRYVDGVIIGRNIVILKTDGVVVEALLGQANALDDYALESRREVINKDQLNNAMKKSEVDKINIGIEIIKKLIGTNQLDKAVDAYKEIFGMRESLKSITEILGTQTLELEKKLVE